MELSYDWKNFQSFFYAKKRLSQPEVQYPIYLVTDGNIIVSAFSEGEDLSDWVGATFDEMDAEFPHRELMLFDRAQVDQWIGGAVHLTHYYDQIQYLQNESSPHLVLRSRQKSPVILGNRNFLLAAIQTWWSKLFPSTYGVYIHLDGNAQSSLLLMIQRGRLDSFHVPDISSMIPDRRKVPADVSRYLSERYLVPVQGLFLTSKEWAEWCETSNPWPKIAKTLRSDRTKLAPFRWGLAALITLRGYFGF